MSFIDITGNKKAAAAFREFIEHTPDAMVLVDSKGTIRMVNSQTEKIFGYARRNLLNQPVEILMPEGYRAAHSAHRKDYFSEPRARPMGSGMELYARRRDGSVFPTAISLSPVKTEEGMFAISAIRDITDIKMAAEAESCRKRELMHREFVANVSHELRTSVSAIKGCAETVLRDGMCDEQESRRFIGVIAKHADGLSRFIDEILELSVLESGARRPRRRKMLLAGMIEETIRYMTILTGGRKIRVQADIPTGLKVVFNPTQLRQIVTNLCDNAIKYSKPGGRIRIQAGVADGLAVVSVQDTGIGIPKKDLPNIFERFHRGGRARAVHGAGLGLAIVKEILESSGCAVWVESVERKGSKFSFTLPLAKTALLCAAARALAHHALGAGAAPLS